ncbi:MAG: ATPase, partial [Gammaproteobacteria bacterium]|nr:ATPase [Gammaproteobacteria bacterium]NIY33355.1 ATPase [Gammaproteobacteria bacterium]
MAREQDRSLSRWTVTDGLLSARFGLQVADAGEHHEPDAVLRYLKEHARPGIYVLCDLHPWLADHPRNTRLLKDIVLRNEHGPVTLVLVSHVLELPRELSRYAVRVSVALPSEGEILSLVKEEARLYASRNQGTKVRADSASVVQLAKSLRGLSRNEVKRL